ncbi:MAG: DNA-directed RNA polymerase subunit alpha [Parcubacteria group bacterium]|nr:DNA-directed RNA polymerase subunit alpha [Parcubacteria group bacterium]
MDKIPLPNTFELHAAGENRATLVIEPLFAGYGVTIGNALRRVLLSSIPGAAITSIKIKGAEHEFSTLEHVKEDVVDIILNFKKVRLTLHNDEEVRLTLHVNGKKDVTAGDIEANAAVEIINKDQHLATLTSANASFDVEIVAGRGRGYVPTESRQEEKREIGMIAIDSIYTPVRNVSLHVENVRVGQVTTFEQVKLDIETDGTISPKQAVALAGQILVDHFALMLEKDLEPQTKRTDEPEAAVVDGVAAMADGEGLASTSEVEAPAPKKRGRPKKETADETVAETEA